MHAPLHVRCYVSREVHQCLWFAEGARSAEDAEGGVEQMLLVALTSLYTDEREADVRLGVLRVTINVLQRHGAPLVHMLPRASSFTSVQRVHTVVHLSYRLPYMDTPPQSGCDGHICAIETI